MIDRNRCIVVVPVYKKLEDLNENERLSTLNTVAVLSNYDIVFIGPDKIVEDYGKLGSLVHLSLETMSYGQYNNLCKSAYFYELFLEAGYSYMCLVQQDVMVLKDNLEYFLDEFDKNDYSYVGGPWYGVHFCRDGVVGNGGFCIRRLEKFRDICAKGVRPGNEDVAIILDRENGLKIAPEKLALEFSWEEKPAYAYYLNRGRLPMGCHAYASSPDRIGFWKHFIPNIKEIKAREGNPFSYFNDKHKVGEND